MSDPDPLLASTFVRGDRVRVREDATSLEEVRGWRGVIGGFISLQDGSIKCRVMFDEGPEQEGASGFWSFFPEELEAIEEPAGA